jgi:hypothetical protein
VSHIQDFGDATASLAGDTASPAGDTVASPKSWICDTAEILVAIIAADKSLHVLFQKLEAFDDAFERFYKSFLCGTLGYSVFIYAFRNDFKDFLNGKKRVFFYTLYFHKLIIDLLFYGFFILHLTY